MTQEEKQILIKDLCARLPYGVIVSYQVGKNTPVNRVLTGKALDELVRGSYVDEWLKCSFKPYLRPMSSMTDDEKGIYYYLLNQISITQDMLKVPRRAYHLFHWLLTLHFDYYGLIEKGLALEAPEGMYKSESL